MVSYDSGKKFISLAISEAQAGSDVAGMTTWARKTPDGKHYVVQGAKKWSVTLFLTCSSVLTVEIPIGLKDTEIFLHRRVGSQTDISPTTS